MSASDWLLDAAERGNPATGIDRRHPDGRAYTTGNRVRPLIHGANYFTELLAAVNDTGKGDLVLFTDWRGDPDQRLAGPDSEVSGVLSAAAARGAIVKGLIWRSHLDRLNFSSAENRHLGEEIEAAGGECLRDMRVRTGGSHHQKMVVIRHPDRPADDVAYLGGIDLCHSRNDDERHHGDDQKVAMADQYGDRPPWHDVQVAVTGPAVGDAEALFRERWCDPTPLTRNPFHRLSDWLHRDDTHPDPLPEQLPDPPVTGTATVQLLRTYPHRRSGYPFAPDGERSIARGYTKAVGRARKLIYLEDQYLWSTHVVAPFAQALRREPELRLIAVVPLFPDQGGLAGRAQCLGRDRALDVLRAAGGDRVAVYGLENHRDTPVYVHAKVCVIDDEWAAVGSDNLNLRSWTHDSEVSCAIVDEAGRVPRDLRLQLCREHLDRDGGDDAELRDPASLARAYADAAAALDAWHADGRRGERPPGRLRRYQSPSVPGWARLPASALYRWICDPDGRPARLRRAGTF